MAKADGVREEHPTNEQTAANKRRARDRRPFADSAERERIRLGGGPRRRALGFGCTKLESEVTYSTSKGCLSTPQQEEHDARCRYSEIFPFS